MIQASIVYRIIDQPDGTANVHLLDGCHADLLSVIEQLRQSGVNRIRVTSENAQEQTELVDKMLYELGFDVLEGGAE